MGIGVLGALGVAGAAGAVLITLAVPSMPAAATTEAGSKTTLCTIAGSVSPKPALTYSPAAVKYTVDGTMSCAGRKLQGVLSGGGAGTIACEAGKSEATFNVAWKNGDKTTLAMSMADFAWGSGGVGTVTKGMLNGAKVGAAWARETAGAEVKCAAGGVGNYQFAGGVAFN